MDRAQYYALMRNVRHCMAPYGALFGMRAGRKVIEIIPRIGWDKGSCLGWVRQKLNMGRNVCILLATIRRMNRCSLQMPVS